MIFSNRNSNEATISTPTVLATNNTLDVGTDSSIVVMSMSNALAGQTPRDGYILAPTMFSLTGIDPASPFVLKTPEIYNESHPSISIDGQNQPTIIREDNNTFIIEPQTPLTPNSVYVFRITPDSGTDITWAFQTAVRFEMTSTMPRNESTNVPVHTNIEVSFSFGSGHNLAEHFSIYPHVEGEFSHRDSTAVFIPSSHLMHGQIYTVTISGGITHYETSETIESDYIFSFETAPESSRPTIQERSPTISFSRRHMELPSFAEHSVSFWINQNRGSERVNIGVYRIEDKAEAIATASRLISAHSWSLIPQPDHYLDTSGLEKVYSSYHNSLPGWGRETFILTERLEPGFYVLNATVGNVQTQAILQITDLAVQVIADEDKTLVWVHDMTTGLPTTEAAVFDPIANRTYETSEYGIAIVERTLSAGEYLIISAVNGKEIAVLASSRAGNQSFSGGWSDMSVVGIRPAFDWSHVPSRTPQRANDQYWTALQLDRTLFQRSDTLSLWGFVQNRLSDENITHVTIVLTEGHNWSASARDTLYMKNIPVVYGSYSSEIKLPHLDPGSYELAIFHGDVVLNSTFFTVEDYVKPPYQLNLSSDRNAIFANEEVTFSAKTEFFEGTPVPDLQISYQIAGRDLSEQTRGSEQTNLEGFVERYVVPTAANETVQGERRLMFSAEATLPEIGWVHELANVRVFINDINVRTIATRSDENATLTVNVHDITLDRINNGTAEHWADFLGDPKPGQKISAEIVEVSWNTQVERLLQSFEITTNAEGIATKEFQVPNRERTSYRANVSTVDGNGRIISHSVFVGRDFSSFNRFADDDRMFLYGADPDGYDIGDEVELTVMHGEAPVTQGNFLFVTVQNGIMSYQVGRNPFTFAFGETHAPHLRVTAYHFNGHTYHTSGRMTQRLQFNSENRNLEINISTSQEEFRPGEQATLTITTTDRDGNPKAANVNIGIVDEALFALRDYTVDTLSMLYRNINDQLRFSMATHNTFVSEGIGEEDEGLYEVTSLDTFSLSGARGATDGASGENRIRERFEDTAVFASLRTNEQGEATFTFQLPDNITSWRMTASAISDDLYAGNSVQNILVTQPMFLHYSLNCTFLVGDTPYIGVNVYGTSLSGGEQVEFLVWREDAPSDIHRASGVSFERVNIPLWETSEEGFDEIVIEAIVEGYKDSIRHSFQVVNSHRLVNVAVFYDVTESTVFDINSTGLTNITFTDQGRGQFLMDLITLSNRWQSGGRIEGLIAEREATKLIQTHFPDTRLFREPANFNVLDYQTESGGIAIQPYAYADLQTTVMLMPFILDDVNLASLRGYLQNVFDTSRTDNKMLALYGLAMLGEPVLTHLHNYAELEGLSLRNTVYIALGFAAIGETHIARELYNTRIAPYIESVAPFYRINTGVNRADILDVTSITAILAAQLGMPESLGLHNYAVTYRWDAPSRSESDMAFAMNIERLLYIFYEIENHQNVNAGITYTLFGETVTRDFSQGRQFTLRIPSQNMHEFNLISTSGEVGAVSIVRTPLEELETVSNEITISREFFRAGTSESASSFEQDELVRVQINVDFSETALSGGYVITDFLPAGLVYVANSARSGDRDNTDGRWVRATAEGQRITFFVHNSRFANEHIYYYYARVVNPGTFKAEGTIMQSHGVREFMTVGSDAILTINP